jgi:molecular chaperone GrpE
MGDTDRGVGVREQSGPDADADHQQDRDSGADHQQDRDSGARDRLDAASAPPALAGDEPAAGDAGLIDADASAVPEGELAGELDELVATAAQRDSYLALAQRTQADFENYRKRVARDGAAAETRGLVRLARELLPSLDNLDRALAHADDADTDPVLIDGLLLVQRELLGALERVGIEAYGAAGERFDPELHEAVAQRPFEGREAGEIVEVYQPGYRLAGGGLVRPARVLVAG